MARYIFSYGTLQFPEVQRAVFGRLLMGAPDILSGYSEQPLPITDPSAIRISGKRVHTIARRTGDPRDRVPGVAYKVTEADLVAADAYEIDAHGRVEVDLDSGKRAFIYIGQP